MAATCPLLKRCVLFFVFFVIELGEDSRPGYQRLMAVLAPWSDHLA